MYTPILSLKCSSSKWFMLYIKALRLILAQFYLQEEPGAYLDVETPSFRRTTSLSKHDKRITKSTTNLADIDLGLYACNAIQKHLCSAPLIIIIIIGIAFVCMVAHNRIKTCLEHLMLCGSTNNEFERINKLCHLFNC